MRKLLWRSLTFRQLFVCYIAVMLLPMIFVYATYSYYEQVFIDKNMESRRQTITQTARVIDERLEAVLNVSSAISVAPQISKLRYTTLPFSAEKYFRLHQNARFMDNFTCLNSVVLHTYIYCAQLDCILDPGHIYTDINQLDTVIKKRIGMPVETFRTVMAQSHSNRFMLTSGKTMICLQTLDTLHARPNLTLILVMNTQAIHQLLQDTGLNNEGSACILTPGNMAFGHAEIPDHPDYAAMIDNGYQLMAHQDNLMSLAAPSACSDFIYLLTVPISVFMRDTNNIRLIFFCAMAVLLLAGISASYLLARRNYRPIYALKQIADVNSTDQNDLAAIQEKIKEVLASKQKMNERIDMLNNIASYQTFHALITGNMAYMREHANAGLNIEFHGDLFIAALIDLESIHGVQPVMELDRSGELNVLIDNILAKLCDQVCQYVIRREEGTFYVVFCFEADREVSDVEMQALGMMEKLLPMVQHDLAMDAFIFIGDVQQGLSNVHLSCKTAQKAREYTEFVGETEKRIVLYDPSMYGVEIPSEDYDIMDAERRFVGLLLSGDYDQAKGILYQILAYYRCKDGMSLYIMRCRMFGLMNMMLNTLHEIEPDLKADFYKECKPIERILSAKNMHELETVLFDIVEHLIGRQENHPNDVQEKIRQIIRYVKAHYYDPNLGVRMIADEFDLSLPYLSRIFKENTQVGLLSYINQYRIDKAKEILAENDGINLADLAQRVGYSCSQTLIRIFKRHEGMTPGNYRSSVMSDTLHNNETE